MALFLYPILSTHLSRLVLWDDVTNVQTPLPDMPGGVVRVYPASAAVAILPLTPANNYTPSVIFCGGSDMPDESWGNYSYPFINTWEYPASKDCQRITPEPKDGSTPVYVQDDDMLEGRTMGQFIILPTGQLFVVNGALNGTAGYAQNTLLVPSLDLMPYGESLASGAVLTPAIFDPYAAPGKRWSRTGFQPSKFPRVYHSVAILLPDASILIAGSNPNIDVNLTAIFPTTYQAEIFYPSYFSAKRPAPVGMPTTLTYGGPFFNITIPASSYSGPANTAAASATCVIHRGGFTTHAMNMGQRLLQLNNTYTVNSDGSIILHVAPVPPNPNLFQPGPAFMFVNVLGIPSNGSYLIVGNGQIGTQSTSPSPILPPNVLASASGTASGSNSSGGASVNDTNGSQNSKLNLGVIIGSVAGGLAILAALGAFIGIYLARRKRATGHMVPTIPSGGVAGSMGLRGMRSSGSDSSAFMPLHQDNASAIWNASSTSLPYRDDVRDSRGSMGLSMDRDPYAASTPMQHQDFVTGSQQYRY